MPLTDIVVLSYNDNKQLTRCVRSIWDNCKDYKLILVDNNVINRGFSSGCNFGANQGSSEYIYLLNSDAYVQPGCLEALLDRFRQHGVGCVGSKQLDPLDHDRITFGGVLGGPYPYGKHLGGLVSMGNHSLASRQIWLNGASLLIKRNLWDKLKGLNEKFFMFYSDSDFCLRVKELGYSLWYEPNAVVYHKLKSSSSSNNHLISDQKVFAEIWGKTNPLYTTL